jgi:hypothetical protein
VKSARRECETEPKEPIHVCRGAALLGPIAALFLACQIEFADHGALAVVLILLELVLLTIALAVAFLEFGESHQRWIGERLRPEILRREKFKLDARVGPYLQVETAVLSSLVGQRLVMLDSDLDDPTSLLQINDVFGSWRDALEDNYRQGGVLPVVTHVPLVQTYCRKGAWTRGSGSPESIHSIGATLGISRAGQNSVSPLP